MHALFEVVLVLFVGWFSYVTRVLNKPCVAKETACATRRRDAGCFPFGWHEPPRSSHVRTCMHACMHEKKYLHAGSHDDAEGSTGDESGGTDSSSSSSETVGPL